MTLAIELLEKIRYAEERYMEKFPCNLRSSGAYLEAGCNVDVIIEAVIGLLGALDPY
jgi:hypothetical protein